MNDPLPSPHASLLEDTTARIEADGALDEPARDLVLAALLDELDAVLGGAAPPARESEQHATIVPPEVTLDAIVVRGFRGIGERAVLKLPPGPGLTLVCGRNGSGKSSFAEALELLLTGDNQRWSSRRSKILARRLAQPPRRRRGAARGARGDPESDVDESGSSFLQNLLSTLASGASPPRVEGTE
ncbi:MAG TPA: ATP-binding protein [Thermoanaerobaculia bacterium]|nr:ATP-binding protein [Thermoanaerobaculia bacterium]